MILSMLFKEDFMNLPPLEERALIDSFEVSMVMLEKAKELTATLTLVGHRPSEEAVARVMQALASNFASLLKARTEPQPVKPEKRAQP
jgi:hypothetical protein